MIYSYDIEQQFLAGLIKYPDFYSNIAKLISEDDFFSEQSQVNRAVFSTIKSFLEKGEGIDYVIITERIKSLGISFEDNISIGDYVKSLSLRNVNEDGLKNVAQELKNLSVRRLFYQGAVDLANTLKKGRIETYKDLQQLIDKTLNNKISLFDNGEDVPENIFGDSMAEMVEYRAANPIEDIGLKSPHKRLNDLYGSLFRPGNITVVVARPGVGKTTFCLDLLKKSAMPKGVPVLHLDNGEMSKEELTMRMCAAEAKVPIKYIEKGSWTRNKEYADRIRKALNKVKEYKFYYYNVGGMSVDDMIAIVRRFYYSKVGRGNEMVLSFDYIKTTFENGNSSKQEWQVVGEMVDKFKRLIQKEIVFDKKPMISLLTAAQSNRSGITNNRTADNIVDDESVVSLSDRIIQFASHLFLLRPKILQELEQEHDFGTHILSCFKFRHLGEEVARATQPVRDPEGGLKRNRINFTIDNFDVEEKGDLQDLYDYISDLNAMTQEQDPSEGVPELNFGG